MLQSLGQQPAHLARKHDTHRDDQYGGQSFGTASKWLSLRRWIDSHARDILDESDEILHARFQLVYAIGAEKHMDGCPDRWEITQHVLQLVKKHLFYISKYFPHSMHYKRGPPGSFPQVILRTADVGPLLMSSIVEDVMAGKLPNLTFQHTSSTLHNAIRSFILDKDVIQVLDTVKMVEEFAKGSDQSHLWGGLLLLRGLLSSNVLLFALGERRWRVDYGFPSSTPQIVDWDGNPIGPAPAVLAVPYRAKDMPAPNTQFSHPDLTIILTCLSYYYAGLTEEQLRASFEILLDLDDPAAEFARWIEDHDCESLPESLQRLRDINLRSSEQWDNIIYPLFSRNQGTIDLYLSRVVFPRTAKEFSWKLAGSSWDLAEKREKLITGA